MPDRSWDFPLTRAEKFDRLIMTFQTDLALSEREIKALRIQLQLASGHQGGHQDSECSQRETLMSREESTSGLDHVRLACKCTCRCGATSSISGPDAGVADAQMLATPQALKLVPSVPVAALFSSSLAEVCSEGSSQAWLPFQLLRNGLRVERRGRPADIGSLQSVGVCAQEMPPEEFESGTGASETSGSIIALLWGEGPNGSISSLRLVSRGEDIGSRELQLPREFRLQNGEYVSLIRGRAKVMGRLADWMEIATSRSRVVRIGHLSASMVPTFSYHAEDGHEICGVIRSLDGHITGVQQSSLAMTCQIVSNMRGRSFSPIGAHCVAVPVNAIASVSDHDGPDSRPTMSSRRCSTSSVPAREPQTRQTRPSTGCQQARSMRQSAPSSCSPAGTCKQPAAAIRAIAAANGSSTRRRVSGSMSGPTGAQSGL